jgi:hypothetical protein
MVYRSEDFGATWAETEVPPAWNGSLGGYCFQILPEEVIYS